METGLPGGHTVSIITVKNTFLHVGCPHEDSDNDSMDVVAQVVKESGQRRARSVPQAATSRSSWPWPWSGDGDGEGNVSSAIRERNALMRSNLRTIIQEASSEVASSGTAVSSDAGGNSSQAPSDIGEQSLANDHGGVHDPVRVDVADWTGTTSESSMSNSGLTRSSRGVEFESIGVEFESIGSAEHEAGNCRPCAWHFREKGCESGKNCLFCHACDEASLKLRRKTRKGQKKAEARAQKGSVAGQEKAEKNTQQRRKKTLEDRPQSETMEPERYAEQDEDRGQELQTRIRHQVPSERQSVPPYLRANSMAQASLAAQALAAGEWASKPSTIITL